MCIRDRYTRVLGNFRDPGLNVVGTLTYRNQEAAESAQSALGKTSEMMGMAGLLASLGGVNLRPKIEASVEAEEMSFATTLDAQTVSFLLGLLTRPVSPR